MSRNGRGKQTPYVGHGTHRWFAGALIAVLAVGCTDASEACSRGPCGGPCGSFLFLSNYPRDDSRENDWQELEGEGPFRATAALRWLGGPEVRLRFAVTGIPRTWADVEGTASWLWAEPPLCGQTLQCSFRKVIGGTTALDIAELSATITPHGFDLEALCTTTWPKHATVEVVFRRDSDGEVVHRAVVDVEVTFAASYTCTTPPEPGEAPRP